MNKKDYKYKIEASIYRNIIIIAFIAIFAFISVWAKIHSNGVFVVTTIITIFGVLLLLYGIYYSVFVKMIIYEDGFYYRNGFKKGKFYNFSEIKKAYISSGKTNRGVDSAYFTFKTISGEVHKISLFSAKEEAVEFLLEKTKNNSILYKQKIDSPYESDDIEVKDTDKFEEYVIDAKSNGSSAIFIVLLILFMLFAVEFVLFNHTIHTANYVLLCFIAPLLVFSLYAFIHIFNLLFCYRVEIKRDGFYLRTNLFNGKFYNYDDIKGYENKLEISNHYHKPGESVDKTYLYKFIFEDVNDKRRKFYYQNDVFGLEIATLCDRIKKGKRYKEDYKITKEKAKTPVILKIFLVFLAVVISIVVLKSFTSEKVRDNLPINNNSSYTENEESSNELNIDNEYVKSVLDKESYNTQSIPTSFSDIHEESLMYVVAGVKDEKKFEYYEYNDDEYVEQIFNEMVNIVSKELNIENTSGDILDNPNGKIFTANNDDIIKYIVYKDNKIIYGYEQSDDMEIDFLIREFGFLN